MFCKLKINCNKYNGETIDIHQVIADCRAEAIKYNWEIFDLPVTPFNLLALKKINSKSISAKNIYISAGIHGDEPAGPYAILKLLIQNEWPTDTNIWLCPCLNPTGFVCNQRKNDRNIDQNRDYNCLVTSETKAHVEWLEQQPQFDVAIMLHEDWESEGFYLYEEIRAQSTSLCKDIITAVEKVFPIDYSSTIDGFAAHAGIVDHGFDFENTNADSDLKYPEAIYLFKNKTHLSYTLETSSDFPIEARIQALITAVNEICKKI